MRILLVSQMWPGPGDPDLGAFVALVAGELERQGHVVERAVVDRRAGGRRRHLDLARDAVRAARRVRPDVVYGHFLFPAGLAAAAAARAARAPLVLTAHGTNVANLGRVPGVRAATALACRRASTVIAVSGWLEAQLLQALPALRGRTAVVDCGVDLERFAPRDAADAREAVGWTGMEGPRFLCAGTLDERKNPVRLADAFARLERGSLAFVGDGPLRGEVEGRAGVRVTGRVPQERLAAWIAAADVVCQPSLREPFGQVTLEAMAAGRTVLATTVGGPPEFVTPQAGVLVDPLDTAAIAAGLEAAAALPSPNPAARAAAEEHGAAHQAARIGAILAEAVATGAAGRAAS